MPDAKLFRCPFCFDDRYNCPMHRLPYGCQRCGGTTENDWWMRAKRYLGLVLHCSQCDASLDLRQRACACGAHLLPREYSADSNQYTIGIIGNSYAGKSVYLTTLIETLKAKADILNLSVSEVDAYTRQNYNQTYRNPLYNHHILPDATRIAKTAGSRDEFPTTPLIFRIRFDLNSAKSVDFHLFFYDVAGEDLVQEDSLRDYLHFIEHCNAFIWLLGPANLMPGNYGVSEERADTMTESYRTVELISQYLQNQGRTEEEIRQIPVAVCLNKLDLLQNRPEMAHQQWLFEPLRYPPPDPNHPGYPDALIENEKNRVQDAIHSLISRYGNANFLQHVRQTFPNHALFGISSLGQAPQRDPNSGKQRLAGPPNPNRVELPLLWLLRQLAVIT